MRSTWSAWMRACSVHAGLLRPVGGARPQATGIGPQPVGVETLRGQTAEPGEQLAHRPGEQRKVRMLEPELRHGHARQLVEEHPRRVRVEIGVADVRNRDPRRGGRRLERAHDAQPSLRVVPVAVALHDRPLAGVERDDVGAVRESPRRALGARDRSREDPLELPLHGPSVGILVRWPSQS
jgi:hypothetical protein